MTQPTDNEQYRLRAPKPPEGFALLSRGERTRKTDLVYRNWIKHVAPTWDPCLIETNVLHSYFARPVEAREDADGVVGPHYTEPKPSKPRPPSIPEGWRVLKPEEPVVEGDHLNFFADPTWAWQPSKNWQVGGCAGDVTGATYIRREVLPPQPAPELVKRFIWEPVPAGYRDLKVGEIIKRGDLASDDGGVWGTTTLHGVPFKGMGNDRFATPLTVEPPTVVIVFRRKGEAYAKSVTREEYIRLSAEQFDKRSAKGTGYILVNEEFFNGATNAS